MSNMAINTNILALNSHRSLKAVGSQQTKASTRLSSGYRINSAADDAAGLAISEKMRAQIKGLDMASKNTQDAVSLIQTAEGGMQEVDNMLQRIRELTVQASNDTNAQTTGGTTESQGDRVKIQDEINQLVTEIDSMADRVEFNKKKVINGDYAKGTAGERATLKTAQKGVTDARNTILDSYNSTATGKLGAELEALTTAFANSKVGASDDFATETDKANFGEALNKFKADMRSATSASDFKNAFDGFEGKTTVASSAMETAYKKVTDLIEAAGTLGATVESSGAFVTAETALKTAENVIKNSDKEGLFFQVGANSDQKMELSINSVKSDALGIGTGDGKTTINLIAASGDDITKTLDKLDIALTYVTTERSKLGAAQNRLEYTQKSLDISSENLTASESRIRDTDMAKEMMNFTQANVLQQAATSMLAQANQSKQGILQLLK